MIKAVIFDLYGTVLNVETDEFSERTMADFAELIKLDPLNYTLDIKTFKESLLSWFHNSSDPAAEDIVPLFAEYFKVSSKTAQKIAYTFRVASRYKIEFDKTALEVLPDLKNKYKMVILTNAQASFTWPEINLFKLHRFFDKFFISSEYKMSKPNLEFYKKAIEYLGLPESEIAFVGDSLDIDIVGAKQAGLTSILISKKENLNLSNLEILPDYIVKDFFELKNLLPSI